MKHAPGPFEYLNAIAELDNEAAYFAVDASQNIVYWSAGAEQLLDFSAEEVVGQHCSKAIHCVTCSAGCGIKQHGLIQGKRLEHFRKDGKRVLVEKQARALKDEAGNFAGSVEILRPLREPRSQKQLDKAPVNFHGILTKDPSFKAFLTQLRQYAHSEVNILIRGETGSGKEMIARAIHKMSKRASKPFVAINCGTLSREFMASEIFGHKRGAFTGAVNDKRGLLAEAEGGTFFMDEVAELDKEVQVMLLRVLQERRYRPLGHHRDVEANVRILSATHSSLREAVKEKRFREDLMYRLRVLPLFVPPLRERAADIPMLWQHFTTEAAGKQGVAPLQTSEELESVLRHHHWPGNVREMMNLAEFMVVTRSGQLALPEHLPPEFQEAISVTSKQKSRSMSQHIPDASEIRQALEQADGSINDAAAALGVSRATFWRWRQKLGI